MQPFVLVFEQALSFFAQYNLGIGRTVLKVRFRTRAELQNTLDDGSKVECRPVGLGGVGYDGIGDVGAGGYFGVDGRARWVVHGEKNLGATASSPENKQNPKQDYESRIRPVGLQKELAKRLGVQPTGVPEDVAHIIERFRRLDLK